MLALDVRSKRMAKTLRVNIGASRTSCSLEAGMPDAPKSKLPSRLGAATVSATPVAPASKVTASQGMTIADDIDVDSDDDSNPPPAGQPAPLVASHHGIGSPGRGLALALSRAPALMATELAAGWAISSDVSCRLAIADALGWRFRLVGDDVVIDHLTRDPDPVIRRAAARAACARRETGGDDHVLERLVDDPDPEVRRLASLAMLQGHRRDLL